MGFKQFGSFSWSASGFTSIAEAEQALRDTLIRIPPFMLDDAEEVTQEIRINKMTDTISAHIYTSVENPDMNGW